MPFTMPNVRQMHNRHCEAMITEMTIQVTMVRSDRVVGANNVGPTSPLQPNKDIPLRICLVVQDPTLAEESNQSRWKISFEVTWWNFFCTKKCNWSHCVLSLMKEGNCFTNLDESWSLDPTFFNSLKKSQISCDNVIFETICIGRNG